MYVFDPLIDEYAARNTSPESEVLDRLNRITHLRTTQPRMLSGQVQGRLLAMVSRMMRPQRILEIGTFTGYSAICLAEGLQPGGKLTTIDINDELKPIIEEAIATAGYSDRIEFRLGNALDILPTLTGPFDLVFIDADKSNYAHYFELVLPLLRTDGILIADNVLWSGRVFDATICDKDTNALRQFVTLVQNDSRVENVLLTVRDGLLMARKR